MAVWARLFARSRGRSGARSADHERAGGDDHDRREREGGEGHEQDEPRDREETAEDGQGRDERRPTPGAEPRLGGRGGEVAGQGGDAEQQVPGRRDGGGDAQQQGQGEHGPGPVLAGEPEPGGRPRGGGSGVSHRRYGSGRGHQLPRRRVTAAMGSGRGKRSVGPKRRRGPVPEGTDPRPCGGERLRGRYAISFALRVSYSGIVIAPESRSWASFASSSAVDTPPAAFMAASPWASIWTSWAVTFGRMIM